MKNKLILVFVLFIILFGLSEKQSLAITADEVRQQINNTNSQIAELERQIEEYKKELEKTGQEKTSLSKVIKELTLSRDKLLKERTQTEKKITATGLVINEIDSSISEQERSIQNSKKLISRTISEINANDSTTIIEKLLSKNTIAEASNEYNNILSLNKKMQSYLKEVRAEKENLVLSKTKKIEEQEKLQTLKQNLVLQQKVVESTQQEKNKILTETKNKEENYKKLLAEKEERRKVFEKELDEYESQLKYILDPKSIPTPGTVVFSWPLDSVHITSPFGQRWGSFHYGVDLRASVGTPVTAMASGEVIKTGDTDVACDGASWGKWVLIQYNNGLSATFGHLSAISVKPGQKVSKSTVIGLSGNTGYSTGPHLHLSVYATKGVEIASFESKACPGRTLTQPVSALNARFDPTIYLPKI